MNFLRPPATEYQDQYDVTRFNLVWNLSLMIIILLFFVSLLNIQNDNYSSLTNMIEVGVGLFALYILWKTKKFQLVSIFISISSFILISIAFFTITKTVHYTTPMWGSLNVLFTFFMLGRVWGILMLIGNFSAIICYYLFRMEANLSNLPPFDSQYISNLIIETVIVGLAMGILLNEFIKANQHAENSVKNSNNELKIQNQIITSQNKEKEIMLKEIHHRVKNNLQVITSLLRLQAQEINDEQQLNSFSEAINRVKSMALIHEKMYQSDVLANFDLKNYLNSLTNDLIETYSVKKPIKLEVISEVNQIGSKSIVPLSLLFNELISNSIKHGFKDKESGSISVKVTHCDRENYFCLKYEDNGYWKSESEKSFGLELIETMTDQLEGEYSVNKSETGTRYSFTLKALIE